MSPALDATDTPIGQAYWNDKKSATKVIPRVWVRYDRTFLDRPLLRDFIQCDPALWNLSILQQPRGTNFPVREAEWLALRDWFDNGVV